jgi:hypothetical protein
MDPTKLPSPTAPYDVLFGNILFVLGAGWAAMNGLLILGIIVVISVDDALAQTLDDTTIPSWMFMVGMAAELILQFLFATLQIFMLDRALPERERTLILATFAIWVSVVFLGAIHFVFGKLAAFPFVIMVVGLNFTVWIGYCYHWFVESTEARHSKRI